MNIFLKRHSFQLLLAVVLVMILKIYAGTRPDLNVQTAQSHSQIDNQQIVSGALGHKQVLLPVWTKRSLTLGTLLMLWALWMYTPEKNGARPNEPFGIPGNAGDMTSLEKLFDKNKEMGVDRPQLDPQQQGGLQQQDSKSPALATPLQEAVEEQLQEQQAANSPSLVVPPQARDLFYEDEVNNYLQNAKDQVFGIQQQLHLMDYDDLDTTTGTLASTWHQLLVQGWIDEGLAFKIRRFVSDHHTWGMRVTKVTPEVLVQIMLKLHADREHKTVRAMQAKDIEGLVNTYSNNSPVSHTSLTKAMQAFIDQEIEKASSVQSSRDQESTQQTPAAITEVLPGDPAEKVQVLDEEHAKEVMQDIEKSVHEENGDPGQAPAPEPKVNADSVVVQQDQKIASSDEVREKVVLEQQQKEEEIQRKRDEEARLEQEQLQKLEVEKKAREELARQEEERKKAEEQRQIEMKRKQEAEAKQKRDEVTRLEQERVKKLEEEKKAKEELVRQEAERKKAEEQRQIEMKRKQEAEAKQKRDEAARLEQEQLHKLEAEKKAKEELARQEEERKRIEEQRQVEMKRKQEAEAKQKRDEATRLEEERVKKLEAEKKAKEELARQEAERKRIEEQRQVEMKRKQEAEAKQKRDEAARLEEERVKKLEAEKKAKREQDSKTHHQAFEMMRKVMRMEAEERKKNPPINMELDDPDPVKRAAKIAQFRRRRYQERIGRELLDGWVRNKELDVIEMAAGKIKAPLTTNRREDLEYTLAKEGVPKDLAEKLLEEYGAPPPKDDALMEIKVPTGNNESRIFQLPGKIVQFLQERAPTKEQIGSAVHAFVKFSMEHNRQVIAEKQLNPRYRDPLDGVYDLIGGLSQLVRMARELQESPEYAAHNQRELANQLGKSGTLDSLSEKTMFNGM